ncbi:MAG TPA: TolC family protein, partial [Gemmatimonadales bacterium]|nr:TolC family protein [Gemmatimonadales bacterium]
MVLHTLRSGGLVAVLAGAAVPAAGQAPPLADTLLTRLVREAIAASPQLARATAGARAAELRIRPAGALPDPMLELGVMDLTLPSFRFRQSDFTEVDVQLSQAFPWPGTLGARTRAARAEAAARHADAGTARREIVVRTAERYFQLRYVLTARSVLARQRPLLQSAAEIAMARYASGSAPQSDPLQGRVARARLDAEDAALAAREAELRAGLRAIRNVPGGDSVGAAPFTLAEVHAARMPSARLESLEAAPLVTDLPDHPRLRSRRAALEAAQASVSFERLGARPDFTITTRYGARPLGSDFFSAFVGLRLPLWAGRKQGRLADAARADAAAAEAALEEERASLGQELADAWARVIAGAERLRLLSEQVVPSLDAARDAALRTYRVGQT